MIEIFLIILLIIALIIGSITDIRTREVPDWLNYSLIAVGLGGRLIYSIITHEWTFFLSGVIGFAICLILAFILFYAGQWGGGDSKMLMGVGSIIGFDFFPLTYYLSWKLPTLFNFLINSMLMGAMLGILFSIYKATVHWKKFSIEYTEEMKKNIWVRRTAMAAALIILIISLFQEDFRIKVLLYALGLLIIGSIFLYTSIKAVEKSCLIKAVKPEELTEGDWIVNDVIIGKKRICGPKDLGIEKKQIEQLIKLKKQRKIKTVLIKEGMPFVPAFLLGYLITIIWGNLVFILL